MTGASVAGLAQRLIDEGLRMAEHPGVIYPTVRNCYAMTIACLSGAITTAGPSVMMCPDTGWAAHG
jgi:hypothetical protein